MTSRRQFEAALKNFPVSLRAILSGIPENGGRLCGGDVATIKQALKTDTPTLMLQLVTLARAFAVVPVSGFAVGAVAQVGKSPDGTGGDLFLGANMEFEGLSLNQSVHAEQAAVTNAWMHDRYLFSRIAVSASPCGLCRQFLYEIAGGRDLAVVTADSSPAGTRVRKLSVLLPDAFGPRDLGVSQVIGQDIGKNKLELQAGDNDPIVQNALRQAEKSYAPYTGNLAGCALETTDAGVFYGRNFENAAFNPGLTPIHAAMICANMKNAAAPGTVRRVVLAEKVTTTGQQRNTEQFLDAVFPGIVLEYYPAHENPAVA